MTATLRQIQCALQNYLLDPQREPGELVVATAKVTRAQRLGIYANAYRVRIVEAMAVDYQALRLYLGDDAFATLIGAYIGAHPSRHFSMRWVGAGLGEFIRATAPYAEHADLHELARFEWALCHAFDAAAAAPLRTETIAALAPAQWAELTLRFAPSLQTLALRTNAPQLWQALQAGAEPPAVETLAQPRDWLIWRRQLKLMYRPAQELEVPALEQFQRGAAFGEVCATLAQQVPEQQVPARAVALLQQWLGDELIVAS